MSDAIDGQLSADRLILCRPGTATALRARLDAQGDYGVAIRETPYLPPGTDAVMANLALMRQDAGFPLLDDVVAKGDDRD